MMQAFHNTKAKVYRLRRHWLTLSFFLGFVIDNITLNRVDQVFDNIVLFTYVVLAMVSLLLLYASVSGNIYEPIRERVRAFSPLLVQFAFGGLLSGILIFYGRSGTWYESWPFLLVILAVIYGNETIKDRSQRLVFNLSILFVGLFSYVVLVIPVFTGMMGPWIFIGSGFIALTVMHFFVRVLHRIVPNFIDMQMRSIIFVIGTIYASLNFLYFSNIIPPIPLSIKEVGIYHSVVRYGDGNYQLTYEKPAWYQFFRDSDKHFHHQPGDNIYCFASVFAPTRLATEVYHRWEWYDEANAEWVEHGRFSYSIEGGRDGGFRGYTLIKNYREAKWRCTVETERGQVIGREVFFVEGGAPAELVTDIR
ncbi:MAG: DUF2914 domain-containing protein [Candidatus Pacebacteria bacterium]|nr:DUF2914 domain-containing protein [Candidatus Paceibacterota bacterium]